MPKLHEKPVDKKDLKLFRLVNGQHIGEDYMAEPSVVTDEAGNVTGYSYPSKLFDANTGDNHVWSTSDLVKKCVNKFQAEPESGDAYRRAQRGEKRIVRTAAQQVIRADDMDRADAEVSPHNPPQDQPDVADKSRLAENETDSTKSSKTDTAGRERHGTESTRQGTEKDVGGHKTDTVSKTTHGKKSS